MLDAVVAGWIDGVTEREFDQPLMALLRASGFSDVHFLHGAFEFGKDVIAKKEVDGAVNQFGFQSKAGDLGLSEWRSVRQQLEELRTNDLAHPGFDKTLPRKAVLVLTGRLIGGAALEAQQYHEYVGNRGETPVEIWDRESLIEGFRSTPELGLAPNSISRGFLTLVGSIDSGTATRSTIEAFTRAWIEDGGSGDWRKVIEAAVLAERLKRVERLDLSCYTALCLVRGVWATFHGTEPPPAEAFDQADAGRAMFRAYASELWELCDDAMLEPRNVAELARGGFSSYPVMCHTVIETLSLLALDDAAVQSEVRAWICDFAHANPGAAHPLSDRWAVSIYVEAVLLGADIQGVLDGQLREAVRWICDKYDGEALGLAPTDADEQTEVDYALGGDLEYVEHTKRRDSYLVTVILDVAAACEFDETYELAHNDFLAVDVSPTVPLPRDDVGQYRVDGVDVPTDTSPAYRDTLTAGWQVASHHDEDSTRYYLGRLGRMWDHLAVSVVTRDRHWVAILRLGREGWIGHG